MPAKACGSVTPTSSPMLAIPRIVPTCASLRTPQCGRHFGSDTETTGSKGIGDTKGDRIKRTPKNGNGGDMVRSARILSKRPVCKAIFHAFALQRSGGPHIGHSGLENGYTGSRPFSSRWKLSIIDTS